MRYTVRRANIDDIRTIINNSTENGKIDEETINSCDEMRVFLCGDKPLMVLGLTEYVTGNELNKAGVWGVFDKDVENHTKELVKTVKDLIFDRAGYTFIVYVEEGNTKFIRFAEFFGFKPTKDIANLNGILYRYYIKEN